MSPFKRVVTQDVQRISRTDSANIYYMKTPALSIGFWEIGGIFFAAFMYGI